MSMRDLHRFSPLAVVVTAFYGLLHCAQAYAIEPSDGVYRIPYANGTDIRVGGDHIDHSPPGRIDMNGTGGGTYKIVAAADGFVRHLVDGFDKRLDCKGLPASEQKNNYVWIEHANGEWTKYSHMRKGSSSGKAKLKVGQFVKAGTYLGDEGEVGCAGGEHLHFEVGVPKASGGIATVGGFLTDNDGSKRNRIPRICGIENGRFKTGRSYTARSVPGEVKPGGNEYSRHGVPARDYQCVFDQAVNAGYALEWIDGFEVGGDTYYNAIFRPRGGMNWVAFHGMSGAQYQQRFDEYTGKGYRLHQVESYGDSRYAVIFRKQSGPLFKAYHGLSAEEHQQRMNAWSDDGFRPRNVAVISVGGQRRYTAVYEKADIGSWQSKSQLSAAEYQKTFDDNAKAGRSLVYVNAYVHGGQAQYSAIWSSKPGGQYKARHGLSSSQYQNEFDANTGAGYVTRAVTAYDAGGSARYAAIWRK
jgi:Bacterial tandem repeat domain 1/Peptidase family M23